MSLIYETSIINITTFYNCRLCKSPPDPSAVINSASRHLFAPLGWNRKRLGCLESPEPAHEQPVVRAGTALGTLPLSLGQSAQLEGLPPALGERRGPAQAVQGLTNTRLVVVPDDRHQPLLPGLVVRRRHPPSPRRRPALARHLHQLVAGDLDPLATGVLQLLQLDHQPAAGTDHQPPVHPLLRLVRLSRPEDQVSRGLALRLGPPALLGGPLDAVAIGKFQAQRRELARLDLATGPAGMAARNQILQLAHGVGLVRVEGRENHRAGVLALLGLSALGFQHFLVDDVI